MIRHVFTESADMTRQIGAILAQVLKPGDLVLLAGDLGAGKTTFVQGVAKGLGVEQGVTSPTFVIAREHPLPNGNRFVHADAYRLQTTGELEDLLGDLVGDDAVTLVEWGDAVSGSFAGPRFLVSIVIGEGDVRDIAISSEGGADEDQLGRSLGAM